MKKLSILALAIFCVGTPLLAAGAPEMSPADPVAETETTLTLEAMLEADGGPICLRNYCEYADTPFQCRDLCYEKFCQVENYDWRSRCCYCGDSF